MHTAVIGLLLAFWGNELDLMTKLSAILGSLAQRSNDSVDLRVPRIRYN